MTDSTNTLQHEAAAARGSPVEVFGAFLKLGLTSFGGPDRASGLFPLGVRRASPLAG
ncbi:chromate transporter [Pseudomonas aeruginosa]|nr:chromate transporter [Pseudomonas aeruginosa]